MRGVLDSHGEGRYVGLVQCYLLNLMGARPWPRRVVHGVGKALGHAVAGAALLVDRGIRPRVLGWAWAASHVLFVEPVLVLGGQTVARGCLGDGTVGP